MSRNVIDLSARRRWSPTAKVAWAHRVAADLLALFDGDLRIGYVKLGRLLQRIGRRGRSARDVLELRALLLEAHASTPSREYEPEQDAPAQLPLPLAQPEPEPLGGRDRRARPASREPRP